MPLKEINYEMAYESVSYTHLDVYKRQETKRSQTWEAVTICPVAGEIASRYGLECVYAADEITIKRMEQNKRPDSEFLKELCSRYGPVSYTHLQKRRKSTPNARR